MFYFRGITTMLATFIVVIGMTSAVNNADVKERNIRSPQSTFNTTRTISSRISSQIPFCDYMPSGIIFSGDIVCNNYNNVFVDACGNRVQNEDVVISGGATINIRNSRINLTCNNGIQYRHVVISGGININIDNGNVVFTCNEGPIYNNIVINGGYNINIRNQSVFIDCSGRIQYVD